MTAIQKKFIDVSDFYSFAIGTHVNTITLKPQPYMSVHNGTTLGLQILSLQGVPLTEVVFSGFDATINVGRYTIDPTTNSILYGGDPAIITSQALALNYIQGLLLNFQMVSLSYFGSSELYTLSTTYSNGVNVGSTLATDFITLQNKISAYDQDIDLNQNGFYIHSIQRAIQSS
jgi:hypothetical protein